MRIISASPRLAELGSGPAGVTKNGGRFTFATQLVSRPSVVPLLMKLRMMRMPASGAAGGVAGAGDDDVLRRSRACLAICFAPHRRRDRIDLAGHHQRRD